MISREVRTYLLDEGFENIFANYMPDVDSDLIVIYDESAPVLSESAGLGVDQAGIGITVRGTNGAEVADKVRSIYNALVGFRNDTFEAGGYLITHVVAQQYPAWVDTDDRNRHTWTTHFIVRYSNRTKYREPIPPAQILTDGLGATLTDNQGVVLI